VTSKAAKKAKRQAYKIREKEAKRKWKEFKVQQKQDRKLEVIQRNRKKQEEKEIFYKECTKEEETILEIEVEFWEIPPNYKQLISMVRGVKHPTKSLVISSLRHNYTSYDYCCRKLKSLRAGDFEFLKLFLWVNKMLCEEIGMNYGKNQDWCEANETKLMGYLRHKEELDKWIKTVG